MHSTGDFGYLTLAVNAFIVALLVSVLVLMCLRDDVMLVANCNRFRRSIRDLCKSKQISYGVIPRCVDDKQIADARTLQTSPFDIARLPRACD